MTPWIDLFSQRPYERDALKGDSNPAPKDFDSLRKQLDRKTGETYLAAFQFRLNLVEERVRKAV